MDWKWTSNLKVLLWIVAVLVFVFWIVLQKQYY